MNSLAKVTQKCLIKHEIKNKQMQTNTPTIDSPTIDEESQMATFPDCMLRGELLYRGTSIRNHLLLNGIINTLVPQKMSQKKAKKKKQETKRSYHTLCIQIQINK